MTLTDLLPEPRKGPACGISRITGEHRTELNTMLGSDLPTSHIGHALRAAGYQIQNTTVGRHRNHQCTCTRMGK